MRVAIIGSGISGLTVAHYLQNRCELVIFEANQYAGGHTNTIEFERDGREYAVDTGFIVFNDRTYPNFCRLLDELGVSSKPTSMSFSVRCDETGLEYRGADWNGLLAQRGNLVSYRFWSLIAELVRFNFRASRLIRDTDPEMTVGEFFVRHRFGETFQRKFFFPMASAIWSCPHSRVREFPIQFIADFYRNHGLLGFRDRPQWRVINGGSQRYVDVLTRPFLSSLRLNSRIESILRFPGEVLVKVRGGEPESFDHVVFACHSDQALKILGSEATRLEREMLSSFPYERNLAVLHTDTSLLPRQKRAWASWNYCLGPDESPASVTYNMNLLQGIHSPETFCVSLNSTSRIAPEKVIHEITYQHPVFTTQRRVNQSRHSELIGPNRTSFCGAYWGNGFHEDGVNSGLAVCIHLGAEKCRVASIPVGSAIAVEDRSRTNSATVSV